MSKRTPSAKRITAADIDSATRIADDFAASLTSIAAAFAIGLTGEPPSDPLAAALAFQRLSVDAAVLSRAIMARYWRGREIRAAGLDVNSAADLARIEERARASQC